MRADREMRVKIFEFFEYFIDFCVKLVYGFGERVRMERVLR
jgi:hypothetical protein